MSYWRKTFSHLFFWYVQKYFWISHSFLSQYYFFCDIIYPYFLNKKLNFQKTNCLKKVHYNNNLQKYSEDVKVQYAILFNICRRFCGLMCLGARIFFQLRLWLGISKMQTRRSDLSSNAFLTQRNEFKRAPVSFLKGKLERLKPLNLYTVIVLVIFFQLWPIWVYFHTASYSTLLKLFPE